jgi:PPOX class probable F420-dependent enzyme
MVFAMGYLDLDDDAQARAEERLRTAVVAWLTTISPDDDQPQSTPVWFLWDGDSFLIYSKPSSPKLANIRAHPRVSVHLNSNHEGDDAVIFEATARLADDEPPADGVPAYIEKYADGIAGLGWTNEQFAGDYSQAIRAVPTRIRAW